MVAIPAIEGECAVFPRYKLHLHYLIKNNKNKEQKPLTQEDNSTSCRNVKVLMEPIVFLRRFSYII